MNPALARFCSILLGATLAGCSTTQSPPATTAPAATLATSADDYRLVWSDEFNRDGPLDRQDWSFEQGFVRNEEDQWYQPENAFCKNGLLVIEARKERKPNPLYVAGSASWRTSREYIEYTSASATTRGRHSWTYGRFEIRARIDPRSGSWPAFWTLGLQGRWPGNGEIDIMEFYQRTALFNVAWRNAATGLAEWNTVRRDISTLPSDWSAQFHTWRLDWDPSAIKIYLDDVLVNAQDISKALPNAAPGQNPFHGPVYLLVNQAIGGQGGDPSATAFPVRYELDYVRVYQKSSRVDHPSAAPGQH